MERKLRPGEKGFALVLLALGISITYISAGMYREDPTLQGYGTIPLFCGVLIMIFSAFIFLDGFRFRSENKGREAGKQAKAVLKHLFPRDVLVIFAFIVIYCALMAAGVPFVVASPVFLWGSMMYLRKRQPLHNVAYTTLVMAFVVIVFHVGFHVVLP